MSSLAIETEWFHEWIRGTIRAPQRSRCFRWSATGNGGGSRGRFRLFWRRCGFVFSVLVFCRRRPRGLVVRQCGVRKEDGRVPFDDQVHRLNLLPVRLAEVEIMHEPLDLTVHAVCRESDLPPQLIRHDDAVAL